eukprot:6458471-Amphidinium_carterae.1
MTKPTCSLRTMYTAMQSFRLTPQSKPMPRRCTWHSASSDVEEGRKQNNFSVGPSDRVLPGQSVPEGVLCDIVNTSAALARLELVQRVKFWVLP